MGQDDLYKGGPRWAHLRLGRRVLGILGVVRVVCKDLWLDFSYTKISPDTPCAGIIGYLSTNASKNLPKALALQFLARGKRVLLVWQQGGTGPLGGYAQGRADALEANRQANALGYPADVVIIYAVDFDPTDGQMVVVEAYFKGVLSVAGRPAGVYGGYRTIARIGPLVPFRWQTRAWSGRPTKVHPLAHLLQEAGAPFCGTAAVDENTVLQPFRAWGDPIAKPDPPKPTEPPPQVAAVGIAWHRSQAGA